MITRIIDDDYIAVTRANAPIGKVARREHSNEVSREIGADHKALLHRRPGERAINICRSMAALGGEFWTLQGARATCSVRLLHHANNCS